MNRKLLNPLFNITATLLAAVGGAIVVVCIAMLMRGLVFDTVKTLQGLLLIAAAVMLWLGWKLLRTLHPSTFAAPDPRIGPFQNPATGTKIEEKFVSAAGFGRKSD